MGDKRAEHARGDRFAVCPRTYQRGANQRARCRRMKHQRISYLRVIYLPVSAPGTWSHEITNHMRRLNDCAHFQPERQ
jgi:hypothetical protein